MPTRGSGRSFISRAPSSPLAARGGTPITATPDNNGRTPLFDDPNNNINIDGKLTNDPTYEVKVQGTYRFPWGLNGAAYFRHFTGDTWTPRVRVQLDQGSPYVLIFGLPRGSYRLPSRNVLDARVKKEFVIARGKLKLTLDVYNLFNTGYTLRVGNIFDTANYGKPST